MSSSRAKGLDAALTHETPQKIHENIDLKPRTSLCVEINTKSLCVYV